MSLVNSLITNCLTVSSLFCRSDPLAAGGPCHVGCLLSLQTVNLHHLFVSAVLYLPFRPLPSALLPTTVGKYLHASLPCQCSTTARWPNSNRLQGSPRTEPGQCVGIELLGEYAFLLQRCEFRNTSLSGTILCRKTNVRQRCLVRSSRFVGVKHEIPGLQFGEISLSSL